MYYRCGSNCRFEESVIIGLRYKADCGEAVLGDDVVLRSFTIVYADVIMGDHVKTGHHVVIRERTTMGSRVVIGSGTVIDGDVTIGGEVKIESRVYVPTHTVIGNNVFIGPGAILTNDRYPQRRRDEYVPQGPILEDGVTVGAGAVILPGLRIGEGAFLAAGSVVTRDVPPWTMVRGVPGKIIQLPEKLREKNRAKKW